MIFPRMTYRMFSPIEDVLVQFILVLEEHNLKWLHVYFHTKSLYALLANTTDLDLPATRELPYYHAKM